MPNNRSHRRLRSRRRMWIEFVRWHKNMHRVNPDGTSWNRISNHSRRRWNLKTSKNHRSPICKRVDFHRSKTQWRRMHRLWPRKPHARRPCWRDGKSNGNCQHHRRQRTYSNQSCKVSNQQWNRYVINQCPPIWRNLLCKDYSHRRQTGRPQCLRVEKKTKLQGKMKKYCI